MGKNENWHLLIADVLTKVLQNVPRVVLYKTYLFVVTSKFGWLLWQPKGKICKKYEKTPQKLFGGKS